MISATTQWFPLRFNDFRALVSRNTNPYHSLRHSPFPGRWDSKGPRRNANRNPEWWGDFSQLVKIVKLKFLGISRYKFELRFWSNLNSAVSCGTILNPHCGLVWIESWVKCLHNSGFGCAFWRAFRFAMCIPIRILQGTGCIHSCYLRWVCRNHRRVFLMSSVYTRIPSFLVILLMSCTADPTLIERNPQPIPLYMTWHEQNHVMKFQNEGT